MNEYFIASYDGLLFRPAMMAHHRTDWWKCMIYIYIYIKLFNSTVNTNFKIRNTTLDAFILHTLNGQCTSTT